MEYDIIIQAWLQPKMLNEVWYFCMYCLAALFSLTVLYLSIIAAILGCNGVAMVSQKELLGKLDSSRPTEISKQTGDKDE